MDHLQGMARLEWLKVCEDKKQGIVHLGAEGVSDTFGLEVCQGHYPRGSPPPEGVERLKSWPFLGSKVVEPGGSTCVAVLFPSHTPPTPLPTPPTTFNRRVL